MIGHYLSSNNEICYNIKIQTFSTTKHTLSLVVWTCKMRSTPHDVCACRVNLFCWLRLVAGTGLLWEKITAGWLVTGGWCWFGVREKYCWLAGKQPAEHSRCLQHWAAYNFHSYLVWSMDDIRVSPAEYSLFFSILKIYSFVMEGALASILKYFLVVAKIYLPLA